MKFDFRMGTVLVIFSYFWTDNDLVYAPPPPEWVVSPTLETPQLRTFFGNSSKTTNTIFMKLWDIVPNNIKAINFHLTKNMTFCCFYVGNTVNKICLNWITFQKKILTPTPVRLVWWYYFIRFEKMTMKFN